MPLGADVLFIPVVPVGMLAAVIVGVRVEAESRPLDGDSDPASAVLWSGRV